MSDTNPDLQASTELWLRGKSRTRIRIAIVLSFVVCGTCFWLRLGHASLSPRDRTQDEDKPVVGCVKLHRESIARELTFDSELRPFQEVDLHAKVAGYVENIRVDIGDSVKEGDLIATLELPEVQDDLERSMASERRSREDVNRAEAAYREHHLSLDRLQKVQKGNPNLIAQQDIDVAESRERTSAAALAAAREQAKAAEAEVKKLKTMLQYAKITAPFDGVVTARYADRGALIQAGTSSSTQAMPLIRLSDNRRLRLVFPVSVSYVAGIRIGSPVEVEVSTLQRKLHATITRTSQKITTSTRTMDVEVDVENTDLSLIPGMYAKITVPIDARPDALVIPVQAVSRGRETSVYVVTPQNQLEERHVRLGLETPTKVEALEGVKEGELVMIGNKSQLKPGQSVAVKRIEASLGGDRE